mgnify:CR=1 FL=1
MIDWLHGAGDTITVTVHAQAGARKSEVAGCHGGALKIRLAALPVDGRANAELIAFLARRLGVVRSAIELRTGHGARRKLIVVRGVRADEAVMRLLGP